MQNGYLIAKRDALVTTRSQQSTHLQHVALIHSCIFSSRIIDRRDRLATRHKERLIEFVNAAVSPGVSLRATRLPFPFRPRVTSSTARRSPALHHSHNSSLADVSLLGAN